MMRTYNQVYFAHHVYRSHIFMPYYLISCKHVKHENFILFILENDISSIYYSCAQTIPSIIRDGYFSYCYVTVVLSNGKFKHFTLSIDDFFAYHDHNLHVNRIAKESSNVNWKLDGF